MMKLSILTICIVISANAVSQNVGIGLSNPQAPLHISSTSPEILRLDGTFPYISFLDAGVYRGYLWHDGAEMVLGSSTNQPVLISPDYNDFAYFTTNGRLGLGTSIPTEVLDVHGNINATGLIKLNNSAGIAGQVMTSNGTGNPTWKNSAFSNNTRFGVVFNSNSTLAGNMPVYATDYNLNSTDVSIGTNTISINRTGLYHFTASLRGDVTYSNASIPPVAPQLSVDMIFVAGSIVTDISLSNYESLNKDMSATNSSYHYGKVTNSDIHLTAGTVINVYYNEYTNNSTGFPSRATTMELYGYLISD